MEYEKYQDSYTISTFSRLINKGLQPEPNSINIFSKNNRTIKQKFNELKRYFLQQYSLGINTTKT